ncbi:MAG TPA: family 10 glycosylhydrolase [Gemmatimonadaceae bacterium]|nr:family 10 glycosylhydrolase [Gemmatimonadaceae bacterium]
MPRHSLRQYSALALLAVLAACSSAGGPVGPGPVTPSDSTPPPLAREMRGLWIATVSNIDWPSRSTLTPEQQRAELVELIAAAQRAGLNAIVFHVRPAGDAVYRSSIEPWGAMLTGTQGGDPGYDPLELAVSEAHARGMEVHAWINPFRAGNTADSTRLAATHLFRTRRDLIRVYGTQLWMDPGEPAVHDHSMQVITDIVRRYDIDAIHADDYFYPYPPTGNPPFPDTESYARYGNGVPIADWRRANVDRFVQRMYGEVHAIKPQLKVGISPFGIWRPNNPAGVQGLDAYATIYADSRKWLQEGWVDYLAPQLYWAISAPQQSFPALLDWWIAQSTRGRHVWPGLAAYRLYEGTTPFAANEIADQIRATRTRPQGTGHLLYNTTATLRRNGGALAAGLAADLYKSAALVPASPWLDPTPPAPPTLSAASGTLTMTPAAGEAVRWWALRMRTSNGWVTRIVFGETRTVTLDAGTDRVLVQAVDRAGNASPVAEWRR